jgi:hypothetical protein
MGLLDDAIREHITLKRRNGAHPDELARLERDILGPHDTGDAPAEVEDLRAQSALIPATSVQDEPLAAEESFSNSQSPESIPHAESVSGLGGNLEHSPAAEYHPPSYHSTEPGGDIDRSTGEVFEEMADQAGEPQFEQPPLSASIGAETNESAPADPFRADLEPPRETTASTESKKNDVLDGTPDFLKETPEHDRMWFEQKPPKDFDFN